MMLNFVNCKITLVQFAYIFKTVGINIKVDKAITLRHIQYVLRYNQLLCAIEQITYVRILI